MASVASPSGLGALDTEDLYHFFTLDGVNSRIMISTIDGAGWLADPATLF